MNKCTFQWCEWIMCDAHNQSQKRSKNESKMLWNLYNWLISYHLHQKSAWEWHNVNMFFFHTNSSEICHTKMRSIDIIKLNIFVICWRALVFCLPGIPSMSFLQQQLTALYHCKDMFSFGFFCFCVVFSELLTYQAAFFRLRPLNEKLSCIYPKTQISWILLLRMLKNQ